MSQSLIKTSHWLTKLKADALRRDVGALCVGLVAHRRQNSAVARAAQNFLVQHVLGMKIKSKL